jgi:hypothetical protein
MNRPRRTRLFVEPLEKRCYLSISATLLANGSLLISADEPVSPLEVTQTAADTFKVIANGNPVGPGNGATPVAGVYSGVTRDLKIVLRGDNDDQVTIDLGGLTTPGSVLVNLGGADASPAVSPLADNTLLVQNGTIAGNLTVLAGAGGDAVDLGGATGALTVNGNVRVSLGGGADQVTLRDVAKVNGSLIVAQVEQVTLEAGSTVGRHAAVTGSAEGNSVDVGGSIGGNLSFIGSARSDKVDTLKVRSGAVVAGNLNAHLDAVFSFWSGGNDVVSLDGKIGGSVHLAAGRGDDQFDLGGKIEGALFLDAGAGKDTVNLNGGSEIVKSARIFLGAGDDAFTFAGLLGTAAAPAALSVFGAEGADSVTFASTLVLNGRALVDLGAGNDQFTLAAAYAGPSLNAFLNGGRGSDTFTGPRTKIVNDTTRIVSFETFA